MAARGASNSDSDDEAARRSRPSAPPDTPVHAICCGIMDRRQAAYSFVFCRVAGSTMYGLHGASSDQDYVGVYATDSDLLLGMGASSVPETYARVDEVPASMLEPDHMFHEAGKFCRLLARGNYGAVELLYADGDASGCTVYSTPMWERLRALRDTFVTQKLVLQYIGYIKGACRRVCETRERALAAKPKKFYHILRAFFMIDELVARRTVCLAVPDGPARDLMLQVKSGDYDPWALAQQLTARLAQAEALLDAGLGLPLECDTAPLNSWLLDLRHSSFLARSAAR